MYKDHSGCREEWVMWEQYYRENDREAWFISGKKISWTKNGTRNGKRERNEIKKYTEMKLAERGGWLDVKGERERGAKDGPWFSGSKDCENTSAIHWKRGC